MKLLTSINNTVVSRDGQSITDKLRGEMTMTCTPVYDGGSSGGHCREIGRRRQAGV